MISKIHYIDTLLEQNKMTAPLPEEVRAYILKNERRNFIAILKKLNKYNLLIAAVLTVYFLLKKIGIRATLMQSTVVLVTAAAVTVGGIGATTYTVVKVVTTKTQQTTSQLTPAQPLAQPQTLLQILTQPPTLESSPRNTKNNIATIQLDATTTDDAIRTQVIQTINTTLTQLRNCQPASTKLACIGTLKKAEGEYILTIRVYDKETGKIYYAATEETEKTNILILTQKLTKEMSDAIE